MYFGLAHGLNGLDTDLIDFICVQFVAIACRLYEALFNRFYPCLIRSICVPFVILPN